MASSTSISLEQPSGVDPKFSDSCPNVYPKTPLSASIPGIAIGRPVKYFSPLLYVASVSIINVVIVLLVLFFMSSLISFATFSGFSGSKETHVPGALLKSIPASEAG